MAGIPKIGNARGDTNYAGLAAAPAAEAQFYLAKELMTKGDLEGAQKTLYEAGPNLPEHLQAQLGELNMAMARLHPRQEQDPYGSASADERPYVETLRRQELERQRMTIRHLAPRAKVLPEVVGRWELQPNNQFLPKKTLTIDSNADYRLVSADGTAAEGKMDIPTGRVPARGLPVPPSGQMMLYDERSGQIGMMWFEFTGEEAMQITDMDGTKYAARRTK